MKNLILSLSILMSSLTAMASPDIKTSEISLDAMASVHQVRDLKVIGLLGEDEGLRHLVVQAKANEAGYAHTNLIDLRKELNMEYISDISNVKSSVSDSDSDLRAVTVDIKGTDATTQKRKKKRVTIKLQSAMSGITTNTLEISDISK